MSIIYEKSTSILKQAIFVLVLAVGAAMPHLGFASELKTYSFSLIYGGHVDTKQWQGKPYLVVNTASQCAFTKQYAN